MGRSPIQLNPGEIVNRIPATLDQRQNTIQSAFASGNPEGSARLKAELSQADDIRKIKAAKAFVVGMFTNTAFGSTGGGMLARLAWRRALCVVPRRRQLRVTVSVAQTSINRTCRIPMAP
jgi:hypothetical protein